MHSSIGVEVAAPPQRVFELAADVPRWHRMLPHYRHVTVKSRVSGRITAAMSARRPGRLAVPVGWTAEHWTDITDPDDLRLHFRHIAGPTRGMKVVWHIRPSAGGSSVTIEHQFSRPLPLVGPDLLPRFVDRYFIRPIAGRTLATFKALAEAGR